MASLLVLVRLAYRYVRTNEDDASSNGERTTRHDAESARENLFSTLLNKHGSNAYEAARTLAKDKLFEAHSTRLSELAHGKAERDAEMPAWTPAEVLDFERRLIIPAKTGETLLQIVLSVLSDLQASFSMSDATSLPLVERARNEEEVQRWLAEQMELRSKGRYHVHREAQVAHGDKPDLIVSSTAASFQVAIEVKHGGMGWSVLDLERALTKQLAERYLKPATRRWGILVITHHGLFRCGKNGVRTATRERTWRDPESHATLEFPGLIKRLEKLAAGIVKNKFGHVEVRVQGINTSSL